MISQFLTVRLTEAEAHLVARLSERTGLTKLQLVRKALRMLSEETDTPAGGSLFEIGANRFGRHGDRTRQSAGIKKAVRNVF